MQYNVAVYSATSNAFKIAASAGNVKTNVDQKSTETKQAWAGVSAATTDFIALCGSYQVLGGMYFE